MSEYLGVFSHTNQELFRVYLTDPPVWKGRFALQFQHWLMLRSSEVFGDLLARKFDPTIVDDVLLLSQVFSAKRYLTARLLYEVD